MPVMKCSKKTKKGKTKKGWKFGKGGFCYISKDAKENAAKQGKAIHAAKKRKKKK